MKRPEFKRYSHWFHANAGLINPCKTCEDDEGSFIVADPALDYIYKLEKQVEIMKPTLEFVLRQQGGANYEALNLMYNKEDIILIVTMVAQQVELALKEVEEMK